MSFETLYQNADEFVKKHNLTEISDILKQQHKITPLTEIQKTLQEYEGDKPLQIGIVGRVKAGKSSLLNAILFEGNNILPKAATPMTAALTMIEYGESVSAELEFFTEEDLAELKEKYDNYCNELTIQAQEELQILRKNIRNKLKTEAALQDQAIRIAERKMKDSPYFASYDQHCRIKDSGTSLSELKNKSLLTANSIEELTQEKLNDFVGADGRYMPFTKSVTLKIPDPNLKDLRIVDTPGINDPVQSRGARTEAMLGKCDVIFLIATAGQFLSKEDMELMQRIVSKDGIQEIYLIASQADNQLYGSENQGISDPKTVIENISRSLTEHARKSLEKAADHIRSSVGGEEIASVYQKAADNPVICTSGVAYSLWKHFDNPSNWDKNTQFVLNKLKEYFPDYFNDPQTAKINLEHLANIKIIKDIINALIPKKVEIQNKKVADYKHDQGKNILTYFDALYNDIEKKIAELKSTDLQELKQQEIEINELVRDIESNIHEAYLDLVHEFDMNFAEKLRNSLKNIIRAFESQSDSARGTTTETYRRSTGKSWWQVWKDEYEDAQRTVSTVNAGAIRRAIQGTRQDIIEQLNKNNAEFRINWKRQLQSKIVSATRGKENQHDGKIKERQISETLITVLHKIKDHDFTVERSIPRNIDKTGTLKGSEAENFYEEAMNYIANLEYSFRDEINQYARTTVNELRGLNIAKDFTRTLQQQIKDLKEALETKEATLQNYHRMLKELKDLQEQSRVI